MRNNVHGGALREIRARIALHTRSRARRAASLVETSQPEYALEGWFDPSSFAAHGRRRRYVCRSAHTDSQAASALVSRGAVLRPARRAPGKPRSVTALRGWSRRRHGHHPAMSISLPSEMADGVRQRVASGTYATSEVTNPQRAALRGLDAPLGRAAVRAERVDVQFVHRAAEVRHAAAGLAG